MTARQQKKAQRVEERQAISELNSIRDSLSVAYARFNSTTDPDLVDAYIYEINALRSRYNTALRRCRARLEERP